jgi:arginyl-tRNA synthetase
MKLEKNEALNKSLAEQKGLSQKTQLAEIMFRLTVGSKQYIELAERHGPFLSIDDIFSEKNEEEIERVSNKKITAFFKEIEERIGQEVTIDSARKLILSCIGTEKEELAMMLISNLKAETGFNILKDTDFS